ncbi:MAG: hypothetical protein H6733_06795 [Alphaproteobacteria bacterium]|nr:hypothetical protein [Alphaproteobacteria bacterium]
MTKQARLILPVLLVLALVGAWFVTSSVDTGPEVGERPVPPPAPVAAVVTPPPAASDTDLPARTLRPPPTPRPMPSAGGQPPPMKGVDVLANRDGMDKFTAPDWSGKDIEPGSPEERALQASIRTTERRVDMMENMFRVAQLAVPEGDDRTSVRGVLDDTLSKMRGVEDEVRNGNLSYRDASTQLDDIRDQAGNQIDNMLDPDDADAVKLRMGIRPPPDPNEIQEWEGVPFEEAFKDWK